MSLETKLKATEGKFAVCVWDPYPRRNMKDPKIVENNLEEKDAVDYAKLMNDIWYKKNVDGKVLTAEEAAIYQICSEIAQARIIEQEYFVIDDQGLRVY